MPNASSARRLALLLALVALAPAVRAQDATGDVLPALSRDSVGLGHLPLRSVREAAALAPGLRRDLATGTLAFRSRLREPVYVVDGVRRLGGPLGASTLSLLGAAEVPFAAVTRVEALVGFAPASLGEAAGGIVEAETAVGAGRFGARLEAFSSEATDATGTSLGSATVHVPFPRSPGGQPWGGVSFTGEFRALGDAVPSAGESIRLTDEARARVLADPQAIRVRDAGGDRFVPFPSGAALAALQAGQPFGADEIRAALGLPSTTALDLNPVDAVAALTDADVERVSAQDDPLRDLSFYAHAVVGPAGGPRAVMGGGVQSRRASATGATPAEAFSRRLFGSGLSEQSSARVTGFLGVEAVPLVAGITGFLQGSIEATQSTLAPAGFSFDVTDALRYGDIDAETAAAARRYVVYSSQGYRRPFGSDSGAFPSPQSAGGFALPGTVAGLYDRQEALSGQLAGRLERDLGGHRLEAGAEVEQQVFRRFALRGLSLAAFEADADGGYPVGTEFPNGVSRYDQLDFETLRTRAFTYGYSTNGLETTGTEDVDAYFPDATGRRSDTSVAPFRPLTAAGYLRDRFTAGPASFDLGLRVASYNARATTLFDPYAAVPILRASSLPSAPDGIGDDFAIYQSFSANGARVVVGFRDRDGQFYDAGGLPTTADDILREKRGTIFQDSDAPRSDAFAATDASFRVEPRLSIRLEATEAVALTGYAVRLSRRPDPAFYVPFSVYEEVSGATVLPGNAALQPEDVLAGGFGLEVAVTPRLALGAAVWGRQTRNLPVAVAFNGGYPTYGGVSDTGQLDEAGLDLTADLARTRGVAVRAAYSLAFATDRASDAGAGQGFAPLPAGARPAQGNARHALDLAADVHVPIGAGPRLGGLAPFGGLRLGVVVAAQSGLPYTAFGPNPGLSVFDPFTPNGRGEANSARLPWTSQMDVRLERRFALGGAGLTAFAWVENLLATRNTLAVYRATGLPDYDGFAATPSGLSLLDTPGRRLGYAAYIGGPVNVGGRQSTEAPFVYGQPRQIRLGVVLGV